MKDKAKEFAVGLLVALWAVFTPIHSILYVVMSLVLADFITGIYKAKRKRESITSNRMRHTSGKLIGYVILICAGFGLDHLAGQDSLFFARAFAVLIAGIEIKSLDENLRDVTGVNVWEIIKDRLKPPPK